MSKKDMSVSDATETTATSEVVNKHDVSPKKHKGKIHTARTVVLLVVFLAIVAGLLLGNGWGTLSSMGLGAIAYVCPLGALETFVAGHSPVLRTVLALVCALVVVALIGRAFCAWVCPVPPLRRFFHPNADKKGAEKTKAKEEKAQAHEGSHTCGSCATCSSCALPPVGGKRDGVQIDSRHGVLLGALLSSAIFGFPVFCLICPIGLTFAVVVGVYRTIFQQDPTISVLIFAAILLIEVVFFRKWCHKICPLGALMSLVGAKAPFLRPRVMADTCLREKGVDCQACVHACPEHLDPHSGSIPECSKCGICAEVCPAKAITFRNHRGVSASAEEFDAEEKPAV